VTLGLIATLGLLWTAQEPPPAEPATGTSSTAADLLPPLDPLGLEDPSLLRADLSTTSTTSYDLGGATISGRRRKRALPASQFVVDAQDFAGVPRRDASSQLMLAPGVLTTNAGGEGHAHETFLRGFQAGTGQDIEFLVDGVPLNEVSNAHNHGYADIFFIPPEVVQQVSVTNGVFEPEQGDFAFAGTAEYRLGVPERGSRVSFLQGSFSTSRLVGIVAPHDLPDQTFAAFELYRTNGFGTNRSAQRGLALGRFGQDDGTDALRWSLSLYGYGARWDQAGVVRQDDFERGDIGFFDTYDPNQGGESKRLLTAFDAAVGPTDAELSANVFLQLRDMRIRENFTGFLQDPRGDSAEQRYDAITMGSRGKYELATTAFGQTQELALGWALRYDRGKTQQFRLRDTTAIPYDIVFDRGIDVVNVAGWARTQLRPVDWLAIRGGLRLDTFSFAVVDFDQPTADTEGPRVDNQSTQAFGFALSPRVTLELRPFANASLLFSYGQGTRSSDATALSDNETAPFAVAREVEVGATYRLGSRADGAELQLQAAYVFAAIDQDLVFEPAAGRNILVGPSTRNALLFAARGHLGGWLDALLNVGWTDATLDDTGERLPYIPELVGRADLIAHGALFDWQLGGQPVTGEVGVGFTFVPGRPLPNQLQGDAFYLLDASAEVRLWNFAVGIVGRNLLDLRYRQSEFNYTSNFRGPNLPAPRTPQRHFVAGEPLFLGGTLTVFLEDLFADL
jgi:iron complex outermembrane recepter protein